MTLIVAPTQGYDSYVSVADADAYVERMGLTGWPEGEGEKQALLRRATQYIAVKYEPKAQFLDPVHPNIEAATVEAAIRSASLWQDVDPSAIVSETIGPLSTTYAQPTNDGQVKVPLIDALMRGLGMRPRPSVFMLSRI